MSTFFEARLLSEIVETIRKYEPLARVTNVKFEGDNDGKIKPFVSVRILL